MIASVNTLVWTVVIITGIGLLLALALFLVARRFRVEEDPRIDDVEHVMPGANCGGCGFAGCRAFAQAAVADTRSWKKRRWWPWSVATVPVPPAPRPPSMTV